jgi:hypothetical protein
MYPVVSMDIFVGEILMLRWIETVLSSYTRFIDYTIMELSFQAFCDVTVGPWSTAILRNFGKYLTNYIVTLRTEHRAYP